MPDRFGPDWITFLFFLLLAVLGMGVNILWYYVKWSLHRRGKKVSWLFDHSRDLPLLQEVIAEAETEAERRHFEELLAAWRWMVRATLASAALLAGYLIFLVASQQS